jgi:hypothetical protein
MRLNTERGELEWDGRGPWGGRPLQREPAVDEHDDRARHGYRDAERPRVRRWQIRAVDVASFWAVSTRFGGQTPAT